MNTNSKIALLFTTRNCYQLFDGIFFEYTKQDFSNYYIFNVDMNSTDEQKELAEEVFSKHDIIDLPIDLDDENIYSVNRDIEICSKYIEENDLDIDWIIWCSHDGYLVGDDFLERLESKIRENPEFNTEVGVIGFRDEGTIEVGKPCYGRGNLLQGLNGWYQNLPDEYEESEYFIVEAVHDNIVAVNIHLYKKHITPDYNFVLFFVWDEISAQFGLKNIASITIPSLTVMDMYREKPKFGLKRSLDADTTTHMDIYCENPSWHTHWLNKYKWKRGAVPPTKEQFYSANDIYSDSIQEKIFNCSVDDGPKTLEDLREH
tara:strand:- start:707 stop:1657 length:951 start_codon:yes stop_codon:yes gene_type:complete